MEAELPIVAPLWENIQVKRSIHLCRLLALFLIVGLCIRPAFRAGERGDNCVNGCRVDVR